MLAHLKTTGTGLEELLGAVSPTLLCNMPPLSQVTALFARDQNQARLTQLHYALCTMLYALCTMHYALCTMHYTWCCKPHSTMQYAPPLTSHSSFCKRSKPGTPHLIGKRITQLQCNGPQWETVMNYNIFAYLA